MFRQASPPNQEVLATTIAFDEDDNEGMATRGDDSNATEDLLILIEMFPTLEPSELSRFAFSDLLNFD